MTPTSFGMGNYMRDWTEYIDFGAFLTNQGVMSRLIFFLLAD